MIGRAGGYTRKGILRTLNQFTPHDNFRPEEQETAYFYAPFAVVLAPHFLARSTTVARLTPHEQGPRHQITSSSPASQLSRTHKV